jgi:hypothetical protein
MDLGKTLNTPNKAKEGSTLYDPDTTPQAIWSGNGEPGHIRRALGSLVLQQQKGVK